MLLFLFPTAAYMCNNNIPWAINDTLSYGFAAANIINNTETDWCCKCYHLTFTSPPVRGKKMVVQVTSTGGYTWVSISLARTRKQMLTLFVAYV